MPVELDIAPKDVSLEMLIDIYKLFCTAFEIPYTREDPRFLTGTGLPALQNGYLDYRPRYGGSFFAERAGRGVRFRGYIDLEDPKYAEKEKAFHEAVLAYVKSKGTAKKLCC